MFAFICNPLQHTAVRHARALLVRAAAAAADSML
jgi:hypothetical protein